MGKFDNRDRLGGEGSYDNSSNNSQWKGQPKKTSRKNSPYFSDPLLMPRINQYLSENRDKVYIDLNEMVNDLQCRYREYSRRKKNVFRQSVQKAFSAVLQQCGIHHAFNSGATDVSPYTDNSSTEVEECNADNNEEDRYKPSSNNQLLNLYTQRSTLLPKNNARNSTQNAELIDLSSDDDNDKEKDIDEEVPAAVSTVRNNGVPSHTFTNETVSNPQHKMLGSVGKPERFLPMSRKRKFTPYSGRIHSSIAKDTNPVFQPPKINFSDFGGNPKALEEVCKLILHIQHPEFYRRIGLTSPRGFLLHGPPGCGKSLLAAAIAGELKVHFLKVSAPELVGGVSGESEERIRELFENAVDFAPCVLFIDEVDAITPNRQNAQREMERRIVAQLLTCLDELNNVPNGDQVLVIGATNRPDSLDPALRRAGRFDREVCLGIPDLKAREQILKVLCKNLKMCPNFSYEEVAMNTPGFVGADLLSLTREAAMIAINRVFGAFHRRYEEKQSKRKRIKLDIKESRVPKSSSTENTTGSTKSDSSNVVDTVSSPGEPMEVDSCSKHENNGKEEIEKEDGEQGGKEEREKEVNDKERRDKETKETETKEKETKETETKEKETKETETKEKETKETETKEKDTKEKEAKEKETKEKETKEEDTKEKEAKEKDTKEKETEESVEKNKLDEGQCSKHVSDDDEGSKEKELTTKSIKTKENEYCVEKDGSDMDIAETVSEESVIGGDIEICKDDSVKTIGSDDESDVEVLPPSYDCESPNLETLLSWIRCGPSLNFCKLEKLFLTQDDFIRALRCVQPSAKREGFATVPDVTWNDVGSLADVREELKMSILGPVKMKKQFEQLGLTAPSGILICGPPGCGKTLLAKAVANEAGINFISVKGPELLNMYVGESERAVRQCFQRARNSAPCVIFFDELDALCPKRSSLGENMSSSRVVNQMLTEMDGVEDRKEVYLMAATNRPDIVDPAVLRPGRLDKILYVGLPEEKDRIEILNALTKNGTRPKLASNVNLVNIAKRPECNGYSGADLAALVREAGIQALKDLIKKCELNMDSDVEVTEEHFLRALKLIRPSVSPEDGLAYELLKQKYCSLTSTGF